MSFRSEKRAFLVSVLGEVRTAALERDLPLAEKMLEEMGVGWKDDGAMIGQPLGGATSFPEADAYREAAETAQETLDLVDIFRLITGNIFADDEADKPALLEAAAVEFGARLQLLGKKELEELNPRVVKALKATTSGVQPYVDDLVGVGAGIKSADPTVEAEAKRLRESGQPAASLVAALIEVGAVPG